MSEFDFTSKNYEVMIKIELYNILLTTEATRSLALSEH